MRRTASRNRRRREVGQRIGRRLFAIVGDDRRLVVEVAEIQPAAAILMHVQLVERTAESRADRVALRPRRFDVVRYRRALLCERDRMVHGELRDLLGYGLSFGLKGIENGGIGPSLERGGELP